MEATPPSTSETVELFGTQEVRWYQAAARNQVEKHLIDGKRRICVVLPTGAGKTLTSGIIFNSDKVRTAIGVPADRPLRLLFIATKHRLLSQAELVYAHEANIEFIPHSAFMPIPEGLEWDITCIDEAHHEAMMSIQLQLDDLRHKPIIGLTATPDRADGCLIKFEEIVEPISREDAVKQGYLAPTKIHSIVDSSQRDKTRILTRLFRDYGADMGKTIVFVRTLQEARTLGQVLNQELNISTVVITNQDDQEVDRILNAFSAGDIQVVVNCNKISEGVDVRGCTSVVIGRQFNSYPQLNQVIGRAARPDSVCNVWELVNPLSGRNLDTTVVVGTPESHRLLSIKGDGWEERNFNYTYTFTMPTGKKR